MRCFRCGSTKVILETDSTGSYDFKKGIAGTVLMGPVGAVAGINGKKGSHYRCMGCGYFPAMLMPHQIETMIANAIGNRDEAAIKHFKKEYVNVLDSLDSDKLEEFNALLNHGENKQKIYSKEEMIPLMKEDIANRQIPYGYEELVLKYSSDDIKKGESALDEIISGGYAKIVDIGEKRMVEPIKTIEEIKDNALIGKARDEACFKIDLIGYDILKSDILSIFDNGIILDQESIKKALFEIHPEYAIRSGKRNPLADAYLVEEMLSKLLKENELVKEEDETYRLPSEIDYERSLIEVARCRVRQQKDKIKRKKDYTDDKNRELKEAVLCVLSYEPMPFTEIKTGLQREYKKLNPSDVVIKSILTLLCTDRNVEKTA